MTNQCNCKRQCISEEKVTFLTYDFSVIIISWQNVVMIEGQKQLSNIHACNNVMFMDINNKSINNITD